MQTLIKLRCFEQINTYFKLDILFKTLRLLKFHSHHQPLIRVICSDFTQLLRAQKTIYNILFSQAE